MTYIQLNTPYQGKVIKAWIKEVADKYYHTSPQRRKFTNLGNFTITGSDIVTLLTVYYDTITDNGTYIMKLEDIFHDGEGKVFPYKITKGVY